MTATREALELAFRHALTDLEHARLAFGDDSVQAHVASDHVDTARKRLREVKAEATA